MIEDMMVRNLSPWTQQSYICAIAKFSRHFGCAPDRLSLGQARAYRTASHQPKTFVVPHQSGCLRAALFYGVTVGQVDHPEHGPGRSHRRQPALPAPDSGKICSGSKRSVVDSPTA
ncbi:hypothetical protein [Bradyrhizobium australiense]|uniref:hypothetical protein n=1 Tax=Bradyrhizobium australiense TaxID=2721161 RepID=UPI0035E06E27